MKRKMHHQQTLAQHHLVLYEVKVGAKKYSYKISGCAVTFSVFLSNHGCRGKERYQTHYLKFSKRSECFQHIKMSDVVSVEGKNSFIPIILYKISESRVGFFYILYNLI